MGVEAGVTDHVGSDHAMCDAVGDDEIIVCVPIACGAAGAKIVAPIFFNHPVSSSSAGEQFQSPPRQKGPTSESSVNPIASRRSRLHFAWIPPWPCML